MEAKKMSLMKDEKQAIRKLIVPILKERFFVKTSVRIDRIYQKLKTEGALSPEEMSIKHPFRPDIDILFWAKEYSGDPYIYGVEVKYFRLREDEVYPNIYDGLGEAMMLLTFGVNYASLLHLFDPEIPSEVITRYREMTQNLANYSSISYQSWLLTELFRMVLSNTKPPQEDTEPSAEETLKNLSRIIFVNSVTTSLKTNPILSNWDTKIVRSIIKKNFRIVYKTP